MISRFYCSLGGRDWQPCAWIENCRLIYKYLHLCNYQQVKANARMKNEQCRRTSWNKSSDYAHCYALIFCPSETPGWWILHLLQNTTAVINKIKPHNTPTSLTYCRVRARPLQLNNAYFLVYSKIPFIIILKPKFFFWNVSKVLKYNHVFPSCPSIPRFCCWWSQSCYVNCWSA